eukprot:CAMPEP_0176492808 /NCGR_PEP_ID=MMETSP0200_2-20121128/9209_1 /TAXON_ID=947934 /ORGANISM="Chaetoceros sp., Strain GSL56" /LENGTH=1152 /DNA_ID=CAMNT_0017890421 /DNA_START=253 /DNA_END=3708 /DNA_ORIENTATION=+
MPKQSLVQTWLSAIGLAPNIIETFEAAGIVNPKDLAELEVCHYQALGVKEASDRKKLFYLVQRVKMAVDDDEAADEDYDNGPSPSDWQQSGVQTCVVDSHDNQFTDSFEIDHHIDDDGVDKALDDQYKPLFHHNLSDEDSFHSASFNAFTSDEDVPSPPALANEANTFTETTTVSPRNKREEIFLKRRAERLEKLTPPRKAIPKLAKSPKDTPEHSGRLGSRRSMIKGGASSSLKFLSRKSDKVDDKIDHGRNGTAVVKVKRLTSRSPQRQSSTRRERLERLRSSTKKERPIESPETKIEINQKQSFDMEPIVTSVSDHKGLVEPPQTRRSKRLEEKTTSFTSTKTEINENADDDGQESIGSRSRKSVSSQGRSNRLALERTSSVNSRKSENATETVDSNRSKRASFGVTSQPKTEERKSRMQNPTGRDTKRLSTIPSDRPSIMSPLQITKVSSEEIDEVMGDDAVSISSASVSSRNSTRKLRVRTHSAGDRSQKNSFSTKTSRALESTIESRAKSTPRDRLSTSRNLSPSRNESPPIPTLRSKSFEDTVKKDQEAPKGVKSNGASNAVFVHGGRPDHSWSSRVGVLREANRAQHIEELKSINLDINETEMRIRVVVRKRPMSKKEALKKDEVDIIHPLRYPDYGKILVYQPKTRVDLTKEVEALPFAFDNVFDEDSNNCQIYDDTIKPLIPGAFEGRWASVFAYGQTGSGKTFTMMGSTLTGIKAKNKNVDHDKNYGLYVLAARDLFDYASRKEHSHLRIQASLFEIYGGKLFDLLNNRAQVKCLENHKGRVCFPGLSEHPISSADELMQLIEAGSNNRSTGSTSANRDSSRSHAVLQLHLRKTVGKVENVEHGRLTFIDLAGSERGADTNKASRTTRLEGADINTSLLALKEVIRALATGDSMTHIPFRGSKLTQVLKESFIGKNSRTVMVACVAPNMTNCEHTLNTLRYADRVKERNAESGRLADSVERASNIPMKSLNHGSSAGIDSNNQLQDDDIYENNNEEDDDNDDNWLSDFDKEDDSEFEDYDDGFDELNEVLKSPVSTKLDGEYFFGGDKNKKKRDNYPTMTKKEAVAPLVQAHRSIMTEMLGMVKQEMTLVNCADADRELIDEYLDELEAIQDQQLTMIAALRESLMQYYAQRPSDDEDDDS